MNITKNNKIQPDLSPQSKSFLVISSNYQIETLYNILKKNPSLVNTKDQKNETFLSYAIKRKNLEIAELILTSPVLDYSFQDQNGNSYLHLAVINQLETIVRGLIQKGINVNLQNNDGNTAYHFAYSTGDIKFISILIEGKVDFSIKNKKGQIAEEIQPGTYPEILDISNGNNIPKNVNIIQNKNNTVTINLNIDNTNKNNNNENDKDNNGIIINERGQINKSIRMNWDNNSINNNNNNIINRNNNIIETNNNSIKNNNINENTNFNDNINFPDNVNYNDNIDNINNNDKINNIDQFENISKTKLKYSLVNFSYSDEGEEGEEGKEERKEEEKENEEERKDKKGIEEEIEENGIITHKNSSKKDDSNNNINENKNKIKSSDIFDLTSSISYQEKVANASFINAHVVGEPNILSKKDSNEYGLNDDIVNINNVKTIEDKQIPSLEDNTINNIIKNGIEMSQMSFQTAYQNGGNMNLSKINLDNGKGKSLDFNNNENNNVNKINGQNLPFGYSNSITKEEEIYENIIENSNKRESEGIFNYDNNGINGNINQSNTYRPRPEFSQEFAFSPVATLKEPLNKKSNGNEIRNNNINNSNNINNNNSNYLSTLNINNEVNSENKKIPDNIDDIETYSSNLKRCNAIKENKMENLNQNLESNNLSNSNNENLINNIARSTPTKSNNINSINSNLSQASQNNINTKTNSKFDFNCPVNISEDTINSSIEKIPRDPLYKFLSEIRMEKYYDIMHLNGFDDINLLIHQTKSGTAIDDKQLKEVGINIPGDRAKILIKLQEKAGNFFFPVPKEVYYICQNDNYKNDRNINKLKDWLKTLKIENYLDNFVKNGYHSIELMFIQMESKNKLTDEILKDEIGISKIGHRSRIINKLLEESKSLSNKLRTSMLVMGNALTDKICDCIIY